MLINTKDNYFVNKQRNLFVIIEGPDNVGKSTLSRNLKNSFNDYTLHNIHYSNVKQKSIEDTIKYNEKLYIEMFCALLDCSKHDKSGIILDRSHIGEMVYGPIYRGYDGTYVLNIEQQFANFHPVWDNLYLITLIDNPINLIDRDDGLSLSINKDKKSDEINKFVIAHNKSLIKNKILLDIRFRDERTISDIVTNFIKGCV